MFISLVSIGGVSNVTAQRVTFEQPILVVNTSFLNIRTGPSVQYSVLVTVVGGTELPVLAAAGDDVWHQVATDSGTGWVNVTFTLPRGDFSNVPLGDFQPLEEEQTMPADPALTGNRAVVNTNTLNARSAPSGNAAILLTLRGGQELPVIGRTGDGEWYLLQVDAQQAWVDKDFVIFRGVYDQVPVLQDVAGVSEGASLAPNRVIVNTGNLNIRSGPAVRFSRIVSVPGGTELVVLGRAPDNVWYLVEGDFGTGWLNSEFVIFRGIYSTVPVVENAALPELVVGSNDAANQAVETSQATAEPSPTAVPAEAAENIAIVNTGNLNIRSGPNAAFSIVATAAGGTRLDVVGRAPDGVWFLVEGTFGRGWLNSEFVIFRGTYSAVPVVDF